MDVRLPPIAALRALEASARHLSYTRAAEELHVTQSAISHQIRHVEELWGFKLFSRRGRQLVLTQEGQAIVPIVRDFMDRMTGMLKQLRADDDRGAVRISLVQSFAFKWLVPRLGHFNEQHADIDVWISTSEDLVDFGSDGVDMAIRLCHGGCDGLHSTLLLREYVFPVCSPRFLERVTPPEKPDDLLRLPLLYRHSDDICPRWRDWFRDAGVDVRRLPKGSHFSDTSMAVQAAIDDQGVALARSAHVEDDLAAGRLRKLFDVHSPSEVAYYIICPQGSENLTRIRAFREWLLAEAAVSQAEYDRIAGPPPVQAAAGAK